MPLPIWARGILSISGAVIVRWIRCGFTDALDRARQALELIDPFGPPNANTSHIPEIDLSEIVPNLPDVLVDTRYATVEGSLPSHELVPLLAVAKHHDPRGVLEIGTFFGSTTRNLVINLPNAKIHTADLPPEFSSSSDGEMPKDDFHLIDGRKLGAAFESRPEASRIVQHLGDSAAYDFSIIPDPLTFFFIDGSHTYEYAKSDTIRSMGLAKSPSVMMWHDVNESHLGLVRWMDEMRAAGIDVKRIKGTSLGYLLFSPSDPAIVRLLAT